MDPVEQSDNQEELVEKTADLLASVIYDRWVRVLADWTNDEETNVSDDV